MKPRPRFKLADSTSIVDFNKLAASTKIEDKLEAAQNPECPAEVLDKIVNDEDLPWGSKEAEILKDAIAANPNTFMDLF